MSVGNFRDVLAAVDGGMLDPLYDAWMRAGNDGALDASLEAEAFALVSQVLGREPSRDESCALRAFGFKGEDRGRGTLWMLITRGVAGDIDPEFSMSLALAVLGFEEGEP